MKDSDVRYLGHGFIMKGTDTVWQEKMVLMNTDSLWTLEVKTPGNNAVVQFKLTEYEPVSFTVENQNHDFPKMITYWKDGGHIKALVAGDSLKIAYEFESIK